MKNRKLASMIVANIDRRELAEDVIDALDIGAVREYATELLCEKYKADPVFFQESVEVEKTTTK